MNVSASPKQITIRLTANESAALAHSRGHREIFQGKRFTVKDVLITLLQDAVASHQKGTLMLPTDSVLEEIPTGMAASRLSLVITPELAGMFKILKVRPDGQALQYGEADILRTLILNDSGRLPS